eukprot:GDKJ01056762.1.p1 GENE.GDKJ01056762.1~~GDKJ01056762.1.p1  ORF type:complete len:608 (+),score=189.64 GDKJ01056762.1:32-1825(+)
MEKIAAVKALIEHVKAILARVKELRDLFGVNAADVTTLDDTHAQNLLVTLFAKALMELLFRLFDLSGRLASASAEGGIVNLSNVWVFKSTPVINNHQLTTAADMKLQASFDDIRKVIEKMKAVHDQLAKTVGPAVEVIQKIIDKLQNVFKFFDSSFGLASESVASNSVLREWIFEMVKQELDSISSLIREAKDADVMVTGEDSKAQLELLNRLQDYINILKDKLQGLFEAIKSRLPFINVTPVRSMDDIDAPMSSIGFEVTATDMSAHSLEKLRESIEKARQIYEKLVVTVGPAKDIILEIVERIKAIIAIVNDSNVFASNDVVANGLVRDWLSKKVSEEIQSLEALVAKGQLSLKTLLDEKSLSAKEEEEAKTQLALLEELQNVINNIKAKIADFVNTLKRFLPFSQASITADGTVKKAFDDLKKAIENVRFVFSELMSTGGLVKEFIQQLMQKLRNIVDVIRSSAVALSEDEVMVVDGVLRDWIVSRIEAELESVQKFVDEIKQKLSDASVLSEEEKKSVSNQVALLEKMKEALGTLKQSVVSFVDAIKTKIPFLVAVVDQRELALLGATAQNDQSAFLSSLDLFPSTVHGAGRF